MEQATQAEQSGVVTELPLRRGPGERLRVARAAAGLPLERVADALHLPPELLEQLERDIFAQIPGRVFARGYLRNYARLVGLDPEQILAAYDTLFPAADAGEEGLHRVVTRRQLRSHVDSGHGMVRIATWTIVIGLAALLFTWWQGYLTLPGLSQPASEAPVEAAVPAPESSSPAMQRDVAVQLGEAPPPTPAPARAEAVVPAAAPAAPSVNAPPTAAPVVVLQVTSRTWAEVVDATGRFKLSGTYDKGFTKTLGGDPPYRITVGNANGARVTVDGEPVDLTPHFNGRLVRLTLDPRQPPKPAKPQ